MTKGGIATCVVQAKDSDKDGHPTAACKAMPGDDCDDGNAAVHPGAVEVCDRVDNDCNGKADDGLILPGSAHRLVVPGGPENAAIAWSSGAARYGVAYTYVGPNQSNPNVGFVTLDSKGEVQATLDEIDGGKTGNYAGAVIGLASSKDAFGVTWASSSSIYFRGISGAGVPDVGPFSIADVGGRAENGQLVRTATDLWAAAYVSIKSDDFSDVYAKTFTGSADANSIDFGTALATGAMSMPISLSPLAAGFVLTYDVRATLVAPAGLVLNSTFKAPSSLPLSGGDAPRVAAGPGGFAITVDRTPLQPSFYAFSASGALRCGPVSFADAGAEPAGIVGTSTGYLVITTGKPLQVHELSSSCDVGPVFTLAAGGRSPSIAIGALGYGATWFGDGLEFRVLGPNVCDSPG